MDNLANQEKIDDEREAEEEIKRVREAMSKMSPKEREMYEKFIKMYGKIRTNLKEEIESLNTEMTGIEGDNQ